MNHENKSIKVNEAVNAYEASDFAQAENLSRHVLHQQSSSTHDCSEFTKTLLLAAKSHAQLMHNERILCDLVSMEPQQTNCILSHDLPSDLNLFHGTEQDFTAMRRKSTSATPPVRTISADNMSAVLFLCSLCLDYGLYTCALNLALQLHCSAWDLEQSKTGVSNPKSTDSDSVSDWSDAEQVPIEGDYLSLDLPPAGLTRDLWLRIVECCRGLKPHLVPVEPRPNCTSDAQQENGDCDCIVVPKSVNAVNEAPMDSNDERHFIQVHEFSIKEEQLRTHAHVTQESQSNLQTSQTEASEDTEVDSKSGRVQLDSGNCYDVPSLDVLASKRTHDDYLPGMWTEMTATPFAWRPVRLEDGAVPMAGQNTNNAWTAEMMYAPGAAHTTDDGTVPAKFCSRLHRNVSDPNEVLTNQNGLIEDEYEDFDGDATVSSGGENDRDQSSDPSHSQPKRRVSILRSPCLNADGEPVKSPTKHVRFSLGSAHPSPALEAEYGGRSNRRRLLDFARRRQLRAYMTGDLSDSSSNPYGFLFQTNVCLFGWCARSLRRLMRTLHTLFFVRLGLFASLCVFSWLVIGLTLWFCSSTLHIPIAQLFWLDNGNFSTELDSESSARSSTGEHLCRSVFGWLRDNLPIGVMRRV